MYQKRHSVHHWLSTIEFEALPKGFNFKQLKLVLNTWKSCCAPVGNSWHRNAHWSNLFARVRNAEWTFHTDWVQSLGSILLSCARGCVDRAGFHDNRGSEFGNILCAQSHPVSRVGDFFLWV
jgi:hypothetical protein